MWRTVNVVMLANFLGILTAVNLAMAAWNPPDCPRQCMCSARVVFPLYEQLRTVECFRPSETVQFPPDTQSINAEFSPLRQVLPADMFQGLDELVSLKLTARITTVPQDLFRNLTRLRVLWIREFRVLHLPIGIFDSLRELEQIWIEETTITRLRGNTFSNLNKLMFVHLNNNQLARLPVNLFSNQPALTLLHLQWNPFQSVDYRVFTWMTELRELGVDSYHMTSWLPNLMNLPQGHFKNLEILVTFLLNEDRYDSTRIEWDTMVYSRDQAQWYFGECPPDACSFGACRISYQTPECDGVMTAGILLPLSLMALFGSIVLLLHLCRHRLKCPGSECTCAM
ncbi:phospholipase A2 inhibitor beta-like [Branchiostoma lanceolatum]|uniref:phospholipase A2 inhibitor beta-like n=1 Tax=Branchiostoma lanceolatum TaxID=7740 RepID=UPI003456B7D3